jgi:hypothetical protein
MAMLACWESTPRHFPAILRSQISLDLPSRVRHARATPDALSIPARKALLPIKRYIIYAIIEIVGRGLISGLILSAAVGR